MKISTICIQNFRKLKECYIDFGKDKTLFVGANNSGKTSAMDALGKFLAGRSFGFNDFTLSNRKSINDIGLKWTEHDCEKPEEISDLENLLPTLDVWVDVEDKDIHYVRSIIPTLKWRTGFLGVRLLYQPKNIEVLFSDYREAYFVARRTENKNFKLFPKKLCEFIDKKLNFYFSIKSYLLDPEKFNDPTPQNTVFDMKCHVDNPLKEIIKINMISAQRGFSDPETTEANTTRLSTQMRGYYDKHLDPEKSPSQEDLELLKVTEKARSSFDKNLTSRLKPAIRELEELGYPGINNPNITIKSRVNATDTLNHDSAIQYSLGAKEEGLLLPEKYNGLGYQNLISIVFDLMSFRDGWMRKGKANFVQESENTIIEPLHLVLIEEPEAHLHMQVQQIFIRKAYDVLRNHENLKKNREFSTQLIISTHSSHIAREEGFGNLRYFKRLPKGEECDIATTKVINLSNVFGEEEETAKFVTRYLQTTHCDLFFADAAILVEGLAENMLVPHFIRNKYEKLNQRYITILSINGKHSHRLSPLIKKLALPTLVITDLDSVEATGQHEKAIPVRNKNLISSNFAITGWIVKEKEFDTLLDMNSDKKILSGSGVCSYEIRVAYQTPINIPFKGTKIEALARTFEDSLIYSNINTFKTIDTSNGGSLLKTVYNKLKENITFDEFQEKICKALDNSTWKAEFILDLIYAIDPEELKVPNYIHEGLEWLQETLISED